MLKRDLYNEGIPTKSQRDDVRFLGDLLGRVIRKQEGQNFFNLVEKIRLISKANVKNINNKKRFKIIISEINKLSPINIFKLSRAFTHFMNFVNLTETLDRYAQTGKEYTDILEQIIKQNDLSDFETVQLTNSVVKKDIQL